MDNLVTAEERHKQSGMLYPLAPGEERERLTSCESINGTISYIRNRLLEIVYTPDSVSRCRDTSPDAPASTAPPWTHAAILNWLVR